MSRISSSTVQSAVPPIPSKRTSLGKWLDLAARLEAEGARDNRDDSPSIRPNVPNVPQSLSLPIAVARGLAALPTMACPHDLNSMRHILNCADATAAVNEQQLMVTLMAVLADAATRG